MRGSMRSRVSLLVALYLGGANPSLGIDSYRYLHVSIETPWMIFLFLLVAVFAPFVLLVGLMWWHPKIKSVTDAAKLKKDAP